MLVVRVSDRRRDQYSPQVPLAFANTGLPRALNGRWAKCAKLAEAAPSIDAVAVTYLEWLRGLNLHA